MRKRLFLLKFVSKNIIAFHTVPVTPPYATIRQVELETNYHFVMAYLASFATNLPPQIEVEDSLLQKNHCRNAKTGIWI